jgi:hypothetical protein
MKRARAWIVATGSVVFAAPAGAATRSVGPGQTYATPCAAVAGAQAGDVIQVDAAGNYNGDTCSWSTDNLTITGVNGRAKIDLTGVTPSGQKGIFTIEGTASATIENFELSGAAISAANGNNGAGIRHQGLNLTVRNCFIHDNQDGILAAPAVANTGTVLIERSEFSANGAGDGFSHNLYIGNFATFVLQYSYSHRANVGHLVKSRAYSTYVLYDRLTDETGGMASYETDIPNAGTAYVIGNIIEQSPTTQNSTIMTFGEEGTPSGYDTHLFVINNTILNGLGSGTFINDSTNTPAVLTNNIFYNGGTITNQASATLTTNFSMSSPMFVDLTSYDVNLVAGSPCINAGTSPGTSGSQSLTPVFEYVHSLSEEPRIIVGPAIDIGAYEYGNPGDAGLSADGLSADGEGADSSHLADAAPQADTGPVSMTPDGRAEAAPPAELDGSSAAPAEGGATMTEIGSSGGCGCLLGGASAGGPRRLARPSVLAALLLVRRRRRQGMHR